MVSKGVAIMGVMESDDLVVDQERVQAFLMSLRKLPPKKQERVFRMLDLLESAETCDECQEIAQAISEIIAKAAGRWPRGKVEDLEEGVGDQAKKTVSAYHRNIGEAIRKCREKLKITQEELAERSGLPQSHISRLEAGKHAPTRVTIERLADAMGVKPSQLDLLYNDY
jgi:DNA-binding transcriptional regulator YiaG